jgi:tRNA(Ile)-lysidine synthase TilS/MesJ
MSISQLYVGSIIEYLKTNSIYEINGVTMDTSNYDETFRYTVRTLVSPLDEKVNEIMIANVSQLASLHFIYFLIKRTN